MTPTTPSPISEQAAGEREAFEACMKGLSGYPFAGQFANLMWTSWQARAALSTAPTTGSTPEAFDSHEVDHGTHVEIVPHYSDDTEIDARRYRWLRNPDVDVALVLDKVTGEVPTTEGLIGGGYKTYEYRAGVDLDTAIDKAMGAYCDPAKVEETFYREGDGYEAYATLFAWYAWQAARATAEQSRDSVIEECALIVEQHQETFTTMSGGEEERHLTTRRHGNQMGMAYANAIRALKSQQDAAIESKPAEQSQPVAWISVDERLPKACTEVLVWRIDSGPFIAQLVAPCDVPDADDESDDLRWLADAYGWQEGSEKPTYWKPLPEGPIVESQRSGDGS